VFQPHDALAGLHYTPFLAALEVGFGLAMLIGGALLRAARTQIRTVNGLAVGLGIVMVTLAGAAALGLGIVILADAWPTEVHRWLNADHRDGVLFVAAGAVALCAAIASPFVMAPTASSRVALPPSEPPPPPEPEADTTAAQATPPATESKPAPDKESSKETKATPAKAKKTAPAKKDTGAAPAKPDLVPAPDAR
jgi:hypothetical protein